MDESIKTHVTLFVDEKGNPVRGFLIEPQFDKYKYTQYKDSKIVSQKEALTLETMKELILKEKKQ